MLLRRCSKDGVPEPQLEIVSDTASAHDEASWQRGWGLAVRTDCHLRCHRPTVAAAALFQAIMMLMHGHDGRK